MRQGLIEEYDDSILFHLPNHRDMFLISFLPVWLAGWFFGVIACIYAISNGSIYNLNPTEPPVFLTGFVFIWLTGWLCGGGYVIYVLLKMVFGIEMLKFTNEALVIRQKVLWFVWERTYPQAQIWQLRTRSKSKLSTFYWRTRDFGRGEETLEFDYESRTVQFAAGIGERAAAKILEEVQEKFPRYKPRDSAQRYSWDALPRDL